MSDEQDKTEIEATGSVDEDGNVSIEATLGRARITLAWHVDESEDPDMLARCLPTIAEQVLDQLVNEQAAHRG